MIGTSYAQRAGDAVAIAIDREMSPWCSSASKRIFDGALATLGLLVTLPAMAVIALIVRLTSPGPILFRQLRVGQNGTLFELLKFRTMNGSSGSAVTQRGDSRITRVGSVLRRMKFDELPQLLNVLLGDMSLVGPRPDLPEFWSTLEPQCRSIMRLRPGLTGLASLRYRDEETLLASVPRERLHEYYVSHILPHKVQLDLEYAERATLLSDIRVLLATLLRVCRSV